MQTTTLPMTAETSSGFLDGISKSPALIGLAVLVINLGGRYLTTDITRYDEKVLNNKVMKKLTIFSIAFLSTRDIRYSVIIVFLYTILFNPCGLAYKILKRAQTSLVPLLNLRTSAPLDDNSLMGITAIQKRGGGGGGKTINLLF
jgi:hypothetical protein